MANLKLATPGAIGARVATAVTKPTAAGITGSSAMLSDGVHPAVDTFYGVLLRLFIEAGSAPTQQRWSRPDAVRLPVDAPTHPGETATAGAVTGPCLDATRWPSAQTRTHCARTI